MVELKPFYNDEIIKSVSANLILDGDLIRYEGVIKGNIDQLIIPHLKPRERKYDLWEHTCFEIFLKNSNSDDYIELNFAPSGDWNAFYISSYRVNEGEYNEVSDVKITLEKNMTSLVLKATILKEEMLLFSDEQLSNNLVCGFTCVSENVDKELNYWAVEHNKEMPDFHDNNSFISYSLSDF